MESTENTIHYCCVSKGGRIFYSFSGGNADIEKLAGLCLERAPSYHTWYFHVTWKKIFGFLMDGAYVCFAIADEGLGKTGVLRFLENLRDEFQIVASRGSRRTMSNLDTLCLQEQLVPVIQHLVSSSENVSVNTDTQWPTEIPPNSPAHNTSNGLIDGGSSSKAPLLGKSSKHEKKKVKDHIVDVLDIELGDHRKSTERGTRVDSDALDPNEQSSSASSISLQKDFGSMRYRSTSPNVRKTWCRHVRIILAIDAVVCLVLFVIWLVICRGMECIR